MSYHICVAYFGDLSDPGRSRVRELADQYVLDPQVQQFFQEKNPWALRNIIERLMEAVQRGLWEQPDEAQLAQMRQVYMQLEGELEDRMDTTQPSGG